MASDLMAKGIQLSKSFRGVYVTADIPETVTMERSDLKKPVVRSLVILLRRSRSSFALLRNRGKGLAPEPWFRPQTEDKGRPDASLISERRILKRTNSYL
jgi:hypothetical protein